MAVVRDACEEERRGTEGDTQVVCLDFFGTTRNSDAGGLVDDQLEEEFECFRCDGVSDVRLRTGGTRPRRVRQTHTDNNRRGLRDFANFLILLHNLLNARLCGIYIPTEARHVASLISGFLETKRKKKRTTGNFVDLFLFFMMTNERRRVI